MPTQKKKMKKVGKVKIKQESDIVLKPLSYYVDDRVELMRQAFMCVKSKSIKSILPEHLQGKSIEKVKELCLDEVLGISTKRLLALINNEKCPSDTDSSDDSDVDNIEEHISLDEISSDSEVGGSKAKSRKSATSKMAINKNGGEKGEKEMTVLELLELQARARAIRSQLALEPVTKIELDSDAKSADGSDSGHKSSKRITKIVDASNNENAQQSGAQRVRLKRNFRIRQVGDESDDNQSKPVEVESSKPAVVVEESKEEVPIENVEEDLKDDCCSSPEVIPIAVSPETLCISSESENDAEPPKKKSSIFVQGFGEITKTVDSNNEPDVPIEEKVPDEPEDGEIFEEEAEDKTVKKLKDVVEEKNNDEALVVESNPTKVSSTLDDESVSVGLEKEELDYEMKENSDSDVEKNSSAEIEEDSLKNNSAAKSVVSDSEPESDVDAEGVPAAEAASEEDVEEEKDHDIVEINDSSDDSMAEDKQNKEKAEMSKSWSSRWLESSKVTKIMAASRLGNKLRDKIKKKKKKLHEVHEAEKPKPESPKVEPEISLHEEGSIQHYQEIVAKQVDEEKKSDREAGDKET